MLLKQKDMTEKSEGKKEKSSRSYFSPVWSYFKVCEDNAVLADCLLCGARMTRGGSAPSRCGTTNLRRHVLYAHNISLPSAKKETGKYRKVKLYLCICNFLFYTNNNILKTNILFY